MDFVVVDYKFTQCSLHGGTQKSIRTFKAIIWSAEDLPSTKYIDTVKDISKIWNYQNHCLLLNFHSCEDQDYIETKEAGKVYKRLTRELNISVLLITTYFPQITFENLKGLRQIRPDLLI